MTFLPNVGIGAAAAESLKGQAEQLVQAVAVCKLGAGGEDFAAVPVAHA